MFRKLVTNLPFQPALLGQVGFYLRRSRQEVTLRKIGFILVILVIILQIFSLISPTRSSLATHSADIIYGAAGQQDVLQAYRNNRDQLGRTDIQAIFNYYGIGTDQIANARSATLTDNRDRTYITTSRVGTNMPASFNEIPGALDGGIYEFPLSYWNKGQMAQSYPTITGMSTYGFRFWVILNGSGSIVFEKGAKKPILEISKKLVAGPLVAENNAVTYTLEFRNSGAANADNVTIIDTIPANLGYSSFTSNTDLVVEQEGQKLTWKLNNPNSVLPPSTRWFTIALQLKALPIADGSQLVCNTASIAARNATTVNANNSDNERCMTIIKQTCPGTGLPIPPGGVDACTTNCADGSISTFNSTCPVPQLACQSLSITNQPAWNSRVFETAIVSQNGTSGKQISYYVNDQKVSTIPVSDDSKTQSFTYTFNGSGTYKVRAYLEAVKGMVQQSQGCTLDVLIEKPSDPTARISTDKTVSNITQNIGNAHNTTANPGDILSYTITISNSGDAPATNFVLSGEYGENIADILEYSELTDKGDATFSDLTQSLSWEPITIPAGNNVQKFFRVTVKNPIPATPASASNPISFDYTLRNTYGRTVTVLLKKPANKVIEQAVMTLPTTSTGISIVISACGCLIVAFFYYRSRLLNQELEIIHKEFSSGGL